MILACHNKHWVSIINADGLVLKHQGFVSLTFRELSKIISRNLCIAEIVLLMRISSWNFVCAHALGTCTKFQLEILTINVISSIVYFREILLKSSRNVSETTPRASSTTMLINTWLCMCICIEGMFELFAKKPPLTIGHTVYEYTEAERVPMAVSHHVSESWLLSVHLHDNTSSILSYPSVWLPVHSLQIIWHFWRNRQNLAGIMRTDALYFERHWPLVLYIYGK